MKQKLRQLSAMILTGFMALSVLAMFAAPVPAQAQSFLDGGIVKCGKKAPAGQPELAGTGAYRDCEAADFFELIYTIVNFLISAAGLVAILFIFWGAAQLVLSRGNATAVQAAKSTVFNAILGLVLILLSYLIINYVASLMLPGGNGNGLEFFRGISPDPN